MTTPEEEQPSGGEPPDGESPPDGELGTPDPVEVVKTAVEDLKTDVKTELVMLGTDLTALRNDLNGLPDVLEELRRLRSRDADLVDRLHSENTKLREGELAKALAPLLSGLLRLHDQMVQLAGDDKASDAAMLRKQLLQILDTAAGVRSYEPQPGDPFDSERHLGVGRVKTGDKAADGTIVRTVRLGFGRDDGSTVRVAEVEVAQYVPTALTPGTESASDS
ncbi:nucleotide exchange factor GrpE [Fodinicola acaciae]|uniref:nucleotide exchange factor GrpE n=1 Tax=Fodinicola acaciae TaxID=2681555 RepID=UPI0013CFD7DC|nr:nucleotide exchange factor GrpE [Fodinicola acaciae]